MSPFLLVTGQHPITPANLLCYSDESNVQATDEMIEHISTLIRLATDHLTEAQQYQSQAANARRSEQISKLKTKCCYLQRTSL